MTRLQEAIQNAKECLDEGGDHAVDYLEALLEALDSQSALERHNNIKSLWLEINEILDLETSDEAKYSLVFDKGGVYHKLPDRIECNFIRGEGYLADILVVRRALKQYLTPTR